MICVHCRKENDYLGRVPFRAACVHCGLDLHSCVQCRFYEVGKPNCCRVPGTEWVPDREQANLCEEFAAKTSVDSPSKKSIAEIEERLFNKRDKEQE